MIFGSDKGAGGKIYVNSMSMQVMETSTIPILRAGLGGASSPIAAAPFEPFYHPHGVILAGDGSVMPVKFISAVLD